MIDIQRTQDFGNVRKVINLPNPTGAQDAATKAYVDSAVEGLAWKDSVRVSTQGDINLASPGATIDGITMVAADRFVARLQTAAAQVGIYIWNGAAVAATRSLDMNSAAEVEQAVVTVEEGTNAGVTYRQTAINVTLDTTALVFANFGTAAGAASETSAGIVELATQAEVDAGVDAVRAITPATASLSAFGTRKFNANVGDGAATSYAVTHNFNTRDVVVEVYRNSGNFDTVLVEIQRTSLNAVTLIFDTAPAANAYRTMIRA